MFGYYWLAIVFLVTFTIVVFVVVCCCMLVMISICLIVLQCFSVTPICYWLYFSNPIVTSTFISLLPTITHIYELHLSVTIA